MWPHKRGPECVPHFLRLLFCYEEKKAFFSCYEHAEGKKNLLFCVLKKNFLCYDSKKRRKTCYWKKTRTKTCYCNKTTKSFCYFTKKNFNCPCLKSFISNERRKSLKNNFGQLHKNPMESFFSR